MSRVLSNAREEAEIFRADSLMERLNHLWEETARLTQKAEQRKDYRTALAGVREKSRLLELVLRVAVGSRSGILRVQFRRSPVGAID
jgi:hypothetical protein